MKTIIIILITIFFAFFIKIRKQEHFITWYLPFYNQGTKDLVKDTPKYLTSNLEYNLLEFDYINEVTVYFLSRSLAKKGIQHFYNFLLSYLLKSSKIKRMFVEYRDDYRELLQKVSGNPYNLAIISTIKLVNTVNTEVDLVSNINLVMMSNYKYLFFVTTRQSGITFLKDIGGKRINFGPEDTDEYHLGEDIVSNLNIKNRVENIKRTNYPYYEAFDKLRKGEIDGMFFTDLYPSIILNTIILGDLGSNFILLPITGLDYDDFKTRYPYTNEVALDLNTLPKNYLPIHYKNLHFTKFRPDLISLRYEEYLVCNKNAEPKITYNITRAYYENRELINKSDYFLQNQWNYISEQGLINPIFIPVHIGAKIFYNKITINTLESSELCRAFVGKAKCNPEKIQEAMIEVL